MSALGSSDSPQSRLVQEWGQGFIKKDIDLLAKPLHKDFRLVTYPQSVGRPELTKEQWLQLMTGIIGLWTEVSEPTIHSIIADIPGRIVFHSTGVAKTTIGINMERESIQIVDIVTDEDGSLKIKRLEEFIDSKTNDQVVQALKAAGFKA